MLSETERIMGVKSNQFDPLAYIENAFLDSRESGEHTERVDDRNSVQSLPVDDVLKLIGTDQPESPEKRSRFRKTVMSAPRPRRSKNGVSAETPAIDQEVQNVWQTLPKSVEFLVSFYDDSVTANYYRGEFKESRQDLIKRLLDPELTLEETSRLLGVCPATVRRYTNRKWLEHHRTGGGQRRFRLSDIVKFVEEHGRFPEE